MLAARAIQTCLIISGWDKFVNIEKLIKITGVIRVTLKFDPLIVLFLFSADFIQSAKNHILQSSSR